MVAEKLANGVRGLVDEGTEPETGSHVTTPASVLRVDGKTRELNQLVLECLEGDNVSAKLSIYGVLVRPL
jgi:hypothetical protein